MLGNMWCMLCRWEGCRQCWATCGACCAPLEACKERLQVCFCMVCRMCGVLMVSGSTADKLPPSMWVLAHRWQVRLQHCCCCQSRLAAVVTAWIVEILAV